MSYAPLNLGVGSVNVPKDLHDWFAAPQCPAGSQKHYVFGAPPSWAIGTPAEGAWPYLCVPGTQAAAPNEPSLFGFSQSTITYSVIGIGLVIVGVWLLFSPSPEVVVQQQGKGT